MSQVVLTVSGAFILTIFLFVQFRKTGQGALSNAVNVATYDGQLMRGKDRGLGKSFISGHGLSIHETDRTIHHKKSPKREYTLRNGPKGKVLSLKTNTRHGSSKLSKAKILARRARRIRRMKRSRRLRNRRRIRRKMRSLHGSVKERRRKAQLRRKRAILLRKKRKAHSRHLAKKRLEKLREKEAHREKEIEIERAYLRLKEAASKKAVLRRLKLEKEKEKRRIKKASEKKLRHLKLKEDLEHKEEETRRRKLLKLLKLKKEQVIRDQKKEAAVKHKLHALLKLGKIRATLKKRGYRYSTKYPSSCACKMVPSNSRSVCYHFLDKNQYICGRRQCGNSYTCTGSYTGITCMRRLSTEKVVPVGYASGNYCKIKKRKTYFYVPYAYSGYR